MQAFQEFRHMPTAFWAMVKYVSETLGYTVRGQGIVRTYSIEAVSYTHLLFFCPRAYAGGRKDAAGRTASFPLRAAFSADSRF